MSKKPQWKAGDYYSAEIKKQNEVVRKDTLESLAYSVEDGQYTRPLTDEEIVQKKDDLSVVSIKLDEIEKRRKEAMKEFKEEKEVPDANRSSLIESIKHKSEFRDGVIYNIEDHDAGLMYVFDTDGVCVAVRGLRPGENQASILSIAKNGTDGDD